MQKNAIILDVREVYMNRHKMFEVINIIFCPHSILQNQLGNLPKESLLIIADATGIKSKEAYKLLLKNGFNNISILAGGLVEWENEGLPVITDKGERLSGSCMCQLKPRERKKKL